MYHPAILVVDRLIVDQHVALTVVKNSIVERLHEGLPNWSESARQIIALSGHLFKRVF
jgi:hypothetical protein